MLLSIGIGKKVYLRKKEIGYTRAPVFTPNKKKLLGFICSDQAEDDFLFRLTGDFNGEDFILHSRQSPKSFEVYTPLGKPVYDEHAGFLGYVSDAEIKNRTLDAIYIGEATYSAKCIRAIGDCVIVGRTREKERFTPTVKTPILGKLLKRNVYLDDGELLFEKGITVTGHTLREAKENKKLIELTMGVFSL